MQIWGPSYFPKVGYLLHSSQEFRMVFPKIPVMSPEFLPKIWFTGVK